MILDSIIITREDRFYNGFFKKHCHVSHIIHKQGFKQRMNCLNPCNLLKMRLSLSTLHKPPSDIIARLISASLEEKIAFFSSDLDRITVSLATSSHSGSLTYLRDLVNFVSYAIFPNNVSGKHHAILAEVYV